MKTTWSPITGPANDEITVELGTYDRQSVIELAIEDEDGHIVMGVVTGAQARELAAVLNQLGAEADG